ncbi:MAG: ABC transporter permease [Raoultibacter sp.]
MQTKLALRNIKRSLRDYGIYFVTLVFGVAVFYAFNAVQSQSILFDLENDASAAIFEMTGQYLGGFSVLIACVLGFLVIYANRYLIRRRKHEFGIYLTLGMKPSHVSHIVLLETFLVGLVSLAVGLFVGIILAQGLSFVTAGLFAIPMTQYQFVFSPTACLQTLVCFALIYVVVALFNTISVSRYKLIDLLGARSKNEGFHARNPWLSLLLFLAAVGLIGAAYFVLVDSGLNEINEQFALATGLMIVGTILFFYALSGFVIVAIQRTRGIYFKGLAMFTLRQIASKVTTAFLSLSLVCIMLFFSITTFSVGMGMVDAFTSGTKQGTLYDATLAARVFLNETAAAPSSGGEEPSPAAIARAQDVSADAQAYNYDIAAKLAPEIGTWNDFVGESYQMDLYYYEGLSYAMLFDALDYHLENENQDEMMRNLGGMQLLGVSQVNALRQATGNPPVKLGEDEYAVNETTDVAKEFSQRLANYTQGITIGSTTLKSATTTLVNQPLSVSGFANDASQIIVPDAVIAALDSAPYVSYLNINYSVDRSAGDAALQAGLAQALPPSEKAQANNSTFDLRPWPVTTTYTSDEMLAQADGFRMMITYLALYIGFIFLITTAAVLAIQQLSETSDSIARYRMLAQIGCDRRMLSRSLMAQVLIYFLTPLGLAIAHAACAISVISNSLFQNLGVSIVGPVIMTVVLVVVVYGSYLLVTYFAARGIIRQALGKALS